MPRVVFAFVCSEGRGSAAGARHPREGAGDRVRSYRARGVPAPTATGILSWIVRAALAVVFVGSVASLVANIDTLSG